MSKKLLLVPVLLTSLILSSCGGEDSKSDEEKKEGEASTEETVSVSTSVSAEATSENADLSSVDFSHITAFKYGRSINAEKYRKSYVVVFSNQEITLSDLYMYTSQAKPGQYYIILEFLGEMVEGSDSDPSEISAGDFTVASMFEEGRVVDVFCMRGNDEGRNDMIIQQKYEPNGTAKLTTANDGGVAGNVDLSVGGFTLKADFSTPIEKDYWAMALEQKEKMKKAMEELK